MFRLLFFFVSQLTVLSANWCGRTNCRDCTRMAEVSIYKCAWCKRDNSCEYANGNPCFGEEIFLNRSQCGYDQEVSHKMTLLSAVAYDLEHLQQCLDNSLPSAKFYLQTVVTRECDLSDAFDNKCSGFIAVSHVEKAIAVAFRGTVKDWVQLNAKVKKTTQPSMETFFNGEVITYWKKGFEGLWQCMESKMRSLVSENPSYQIWVTGHSLGAAMASLASTWLAYYNIAPRKNIILYTFGMPRVGDYRYALQHDQLVNNTSWRVVNDVDLFPHYPAVIAPDITSGPYHHGVEVYYTSKAYSVNDYFKQCYGTPYNEDAKCSRGRINASLEDLPRAIERHKRYFGITLNETFCKASVNSSGISENKLQFLKDRCATYKYKNGSYEYVEPTYEPTSTIHPTIGPSSSSSMLIGSFNIILPIAISVFNLLASM